ncbi:hypothetical protein BEWA_000160 [Theileria equi strain WA]|uniref:Uncharacterized protein n=1 Tax=Theileria equi strain WA TaxID=1537102 RepID=L0AYE4_THEEQ|nr:hypothetical protein BEWA_000160 [Theileria equi strain WA]AFZ80612.1 hypothetical protein BEWA_000160 [Theileria equi strain WA]|eukprot:XP_004830278.1 hypothetical protein BEWA_000160 [Theileria equi strain WA]
MMASPGAGSGGGSGTAEEKSTIRRFAMFMAGFSLLQTLRVAITAGRFAVVRFGIPSGQIGIFINSIHHSMETAGDVGLFLMSLYVLFSDRNKTADYIVSVTAIWGLFMMNLLLIVAYSVGGERGCLTFYYWVLVIASLGFGLDESISITIGVADVAYFGLGMPLSGIMACLYHAVYLYFAEKFQWSDTYFWIVIGQIVISALVSGIAAIVWTIAYWDPGGTQASGEATTSPPSGPSQGPKGGLWTRAGNAISNMLMCLCGMSCIYAFYPAIAPYQFVSPEAGHLIDLALLFTSAIPSLVIAAVCSWTTKGPDRPWKGEYAWWHATWLFMIPYVIAMTLCIFAIHYPNWRSSRAIYGNIWTTGVITVTLKCCEETLKGVANSGVGMQAECKDGDGQLSALNALTAQFTMDIVAYIGGGYVKAITKYDRDNWPTKHYGFWRSLGFWLGSALSGGLKCVRESFTTDIRSNLITGNEVLFIVYADE